MSTINTINVNNENYDIQDKNALPKTGGILTGDLTVGDSHIRTNGYIESKWLKTTSATKNNSLEKIAAIDSNGWLYYVDKSSIGGNSTNIVVQSSQPSNQKAGDFWYKVIL